VTPLTGGFLPPENQHYSSAYKSWALHLLTDSYSEWQLYKEYAPNKTPSKNLSAFVADTNQHYKNHQPLLVSAKKLLNLVATKSNNGFEKLLYDAQLILLTF
jgi:hypothetical protein